MGSSRQTPASTLDQIKDLLLTPIPLFGKPQRRTGVNRRRSPRRADAERAPAPSAFHLTGPLEKGAYTKFASGGEDIVIDANTWIFGEFRLGSIAVVKGERIGSQNFAKKVTIS
jgi:hypothetical protein